MSTGSHRLPAPWGSRIDRDRRLGFTFEGRPYAGCEGDTIATALAAHGVRVLSRSFKYHRARGLHTLGGHDANALVQLPGEPNVRADVRALAQGMQVLPQNVAGSLARDALGVLDRLGAFLPVGFYYRAFYRPRGVWPLWDRLLRRLAGLGRVDVHAHHVAGDKRYLHADVAVLGGGPAGMSAALSAASAGARVLLVEEQPALGGALEWARLDADGVLAAALLARLRAAVAAQPRIEALTGAACTGWFADHWLAVVRGERLFKVRARAVVCATGAIEQPAVFRNNDLPGVMTGATAQRLLRLHAVRPGGRAVVLAGNDDAYGVALDLLDAGLALAAVIDLRPAPGADPRIQAVRSAGVAIEAGHAVVEALPAGRPRVLAGVASDRITGEGTVAGAPRRIDCDLLCVSVGSAPAAQLLCHSGGRLVYDATLATLRVAALPGGGESAFIAGAVNGCFDAEATLAEGRYAGWAAARAAGLDAGSGPPRPLAHAGAVGRNHPWPIFPHARGRDFVDLDEDLQVHDLVDAVADGYDDMDLVKRYSTAMMGPSQGRHSALNTLRIATRAAGRDLDDVSITTQRPPARTETLAVLAGRALQPLRRTALHHRHLEAGAQMLPAGTWLRPAYYGSPTARDAAIRAEVLAVRRAAGIIDVSTLGKLELRGPQAAELLERMYTGRYAKLAVGRSRYALMLEPAGAILDDGVVCRLADDHYYVTATTSAADDVYRRLLRWNAEWRLDVDVANVTGAWAAMNLAGPHARDIVAAVCADIDLTATAFPYLAVRCGRVAGAPARLARVGFVGELGYEIHVPAGHGEAVWDALLAAGAGAGLRPFGVEAQRVLRLEKGHVIVGQDTDGLTMPEEAGLGWAVAADKPFFHGQRALVIRGRQAPLRRLVGFTLAPGTRLPEECHLVVRGGDIAGRVTSVAWSPALDRPVGLAYVAPDQTAPGTAFDIRLSDGTLVQARVTALPFHDPGNRRQAL